MQKIDKKYIENRVLDDTDLNNIDNKFELFKSELKSTRLELKSSVDSMKWLLGFLVAGMIALLIKTFF